MKNLFPTILLALSVAALTGCDPDQFEKDKASGLKSYERVTVNGRSVNSKEVYTPKWGIDDRLSSMVQEQYEALAEDKGSDNAELTLVRKVTATYKWNNGGWALEESQKHEAYDKETGTWESFDPIVYTYVCDDTWTVRESESIWSPEPEKYEYENGYIVKIINNNSEIEFIWKNGDLVKVIDGTANVKEITYTAEENPFKDGLDPLCGPFVDNAFMIGLAGKRPAHLPDVVSNTWGEGERQISGSYKYQYKKDAKGRIIEATHVSYDPQTGKVVDDGYRQTLTFNY